MANNDKALSIGISACLVGKKVRYDGSCKRKNAIIEQLAEEIHLQTFCPEMAIGLGTPRETVRLVGDMGNTQLVDSKTQTLHFSEPMRDYAKLISEEFPSLSGYLGVKASPSCGYDRVKRYNEKGNLAGHDTQGLFIQQLAAINPLLPIEEDGRLFDDVLKENFIKRVYTYNQWQELSRQGLSYAALQAFWGRHKYSLMAHDIQSYQDAGRLLSNAKAMPIDEMGKQLITIIMNGLKNPATRSKTANVLLHIIGYLKRHLASTDKQEMIALIEQYRKGIVPLIVPMTLLKHHFKHHENDYIAKQFFMQPYPESLGLRNTI